MHAKPQLVHGCRGEDEMDLHRTLVCNYKNNLLLTGYHQRQVSCIEWI